MKMPHPRFGLLLASFLLPAGSAQAMDLPRCSGPVESGGGGTVARVETNGTLALKDGRVVVLEGIRLPKGRLDRASDDAMRRAQSTLSDLVTGKYATLATPRPKLDRHGYLRAQVATSGEWVQEALLREGLARVFLLPTHPQCAKELYAAEAAARDAGRGLWALSEYAVRSPENLGRDRGTFQIVEGRVVSAAVKGGRAYLNFGNDWKNDFTVTIAPGDMKTFRKRHADPRDYAGKTIRVRGIVDWYRGPEIEPMGPESIEVLH
jgi:endonuclease YncB( thermonuclease family)